MSNEKENQKKQNTIRFIEATQELIEADGLENLSIRKIADKAGFHNSTIYLYFKDIEELILLASIKYFNEYSKNLSELSSWKLRPREHFLSVWDFFAQATFQKPKVFYNFFFGKHSENLTDIMTQYYRLFPEEREKYTPQIEDMYYGKNIWDRCMGLLTPLAEVAPGIQESNLNIINDITVSYVKYLLEQKCQNPSLDSDMLTDKLMQMLKFVIN
jgi:Transcriptional regulator